MPMAVQDAFYNTDGTVLVSVTGSRGKDGENHCDLLH